MTLDELIADIDKNQKLINNFRPFDQTYLPRIRDFYKVAVVWGSNAIEGFTYTESETKLLIEDGLTAGGKSMRDAYAVIGHAKAYDHMFTLLARHALTEQDILTYHSLLQGSLDNNAIPGEYRTTDVFVSGSNHAFPKPEAVAGEMRRFFAFMEEQRGGCHPVAFAAQVHKQLVMAHPFADGNGRVARLAMNTVLIQEGFLPTIIPPVLKARYIDSLKRIHESGNDRDFVEFICHCERETQKDFIRMLQLDKA
jgi:Fic family protein